MQLSENFSKRMTVYLDETALARIETLYTQYIRMVERDVRHKTEDEYRNKYPYEPEEEKASAIEKSIENRMSRYNIKIDIEMRKGPSINLDGIEDLKKHSKEIIGEIKRISFRAGWSEDSLYVSILESGALSDALFSISTEDPAILNHVRGESEKIIRTMQSWYSPIGWASGWITGITFITAIFMLLYAVNFYEEIFIEDRSQIGHLILE